MGRASNHKKARRLAARPAREGALATAVVPPAVVIADDPGSDPGGDEIAVLSRALDGSIPGVAGSVVAGALIRLLEAAAIRVPRRVA